MKAKEALKIVVLFYIEAKRTRSIANMFILRTWNIEAKWSKLILNCESSEANLFVSKKIYFEVKRKCFYYGT